MEAKGNEVQRVRSFVQAVRLLLRTPGALTQLQRDLTITRELLAQVLVENRSLRQNHEPADARVFSQFGEDGILLDLLSRLSLAPDLHRFVEIGIEDYSESNTRILASPFGWKGLVIDAQASHIEAVKRSELYWRTGLRAEAVQITCENVTQILKKHHFAEKLGVVSFDIDGNDYWVWKTLSDIDPALVVIEYNALFGSDRSVTVPYDKNFQRCQAHYSWLYWGSSIRALTDLAKTKGYILAAGNQAGNNIFFVKEAFKSLVPERDPVSVYRSPAFSEARAKDGSFSSVSFFEALQIMKSLPIIDQANQCMIKVDDLRR